MREALALEVPAGRAARVARSGYPNTAQLPIPQLEAALAWVGLDVETVIGLGKWTLEQAHTKRTKGTLVHQFGPAVQGDAMVVDAVDTDTFDIDLSDVSEADSDAEERAAQAWQHAWPLSDSEGSGDDMPNPEEFFPW